MAYRRLLARARRIGFGPSKAATLLATCALVACDRPEAPVRVTAFGGVRDVTSDAASHETCHDVGGRRVCFGRSGERRVTARPVPDEPLPADGAWRCEGDRPRRCELIAQRPFDCEGSECRQPYPRLPDDSDWECAELDGLVLCRDVAPAAAATAHRQLGWLCSPSPPRLCLDLSPDRPGPAGWDCLYEYEPAFRRVCRREGENGVGPRGPVLGSRCNGSCPEAMACLEGICVPVAVSVPECWTARDCGEGERCVFARCTAS